MLWAVIVVTGRMIAYNSSDCDRQPQPRIVNVLAGCVVPAPGGADESLDAQRCCRWHRVDRREPLRSGHQHVDVGVRRHRVDPTCWRSP